MSNKGNSVIFFICIIAIIIIIFFFTIAIYMSEISSLLYNIKLDMYSINKSAIVAVNKSTTSRGKFSYNKEAYEEYLKEMIQKNYNLNNNLQNNDGLIEEVKVIEFDVLKVGQKDNNTNQRVKDRTIHSVIRVRVKPLIFKEQLRELFTFELHEDVALNEVKV